MPTIILDETVEFTSSTESDNDDDNIVFEETLCEPGPSTSKRASTQFLTKKLVAALDRCKVSDRDATHLLMATAEALGKNVDSLVIYENSRDFEEFCQYLNFKRLSNINYNNYNDNT